MKIGTRQQAAGNSKKPALIGLACCTLLFALCISAEAQQPPKIPRIGFLIASSAAAQEPRLRAFKRGLRELGYIEGSNIAIEVRSGEGKPEQLPMAAAELVTLNVQVIVSGGPASTRAAKQTTNTIPIVMTLDSDPVRDGLVVSLARPGGNITGLSTLGPDLSGKRLELLREIAPRLSRVAVFYSTDIRYLPQWNEIDDAGRALGLQLQKLELQGPKDIDAAFRAAIKEHSGAVLAQAPAILLSQRTRVAQLAIKRRLPTIYSREEFVQAGGLMH